VAYVLLQACPTYRLAGQNPACQAFLSAREALLIFVKI